MRITGNCRGLLLKLNSVARRRSLGVRLIDLKKSMDLYNAPPKALTVSQAQSSILWEFARGVPEALG